MIMAEPLKDREIGPVPGLALVMAISAAVTFPVVTLLFKLDSATALIVWAITVVIVWVLLFMPHRNRGGR
jgi:hypothetical protein